MMNTKTLLTLGWITSTTFILGTIFWGFQLESYNAVSQTVSEIGKKGSPLFSQWQVFSVGVGLLLLFFAFGIISYAKKRSKSLVPGIFMLVYGLSQVAMGSFPSPHPLHNIFGLSMIIGYFTPLVFALTWRNYPETSFKRISFLAFILILIGIILNLTPAFAPELYPLEYYGLVQRFLLFTFYGYLAYLSLRLARKKFYY